MRFLKSANLLSKPSKNVILKHTIWSGVVMSLGPWYGSSLEAKEARIARPLNTYKEM